MFTEIVSDRGEGPAVVYVPGIDGSGSLLLDTAERLERRFRLLRLRYVLGIQPKHQTYAHLAASLVQTVSLRGVESMLLLAESFGGAVALQAALDHPDRVDGLALVNSFPHFRRRGSLTLSQLGAGLLPGWALSWGRRHLAPRVLFGARRDPAALQAFQRTLSDWSLDDGYRARFRMIRELDLRPRLPEVRQPVLLVAGTDDRIVESVRQAREMQSRLPHATLEIVTGGGHLLLPLEEIDWTGYLEELAEAATAARIEARRSAVREPG